MNMDLDSYFRKLSHIKKKKFFFKERIKYFLSIFILLFFDLLSFYLALTFAYYTRIWLNSFLTIKLNYPFNFFIHSYWIPFIFILFFAHEGLYVKRLPVWEEIRLIIKSITVSMIAISIILILTKLNVKYSRIMFLLLWLFLIVLMPIVRISVKYCLFKIGIWRENVLVIGISDTAKSVAKSIFREKNLGYNIVGFVSFKSEIVDKFIKVGKKEFPVLGNIDDLEQLIKEYDSSGLVLVQNGDFQGNIVEVINTLQQYTTKIIVVPDIQGVPTYNMEFCNFFQEQLFLLNITNNLKRVSNRFLKRTFDVLFGIVLLPFILPLLGIIYVCVKFDSQGNVFYTQKRIGRNGKLFNFIKIRTMYQNNDEILEKYFQENPEAKEEWEKYKKLKGKDPRVTKVGYLLRKTSLDELPQIFNVLKGDMSFVGPRPYLPREKNDMGIYFKYITMTRPGITGLWQISGRNNLTFENRLKLDSWYIANWSFWLDIEILLKTIKVVLNGKGAY